MGTSLYGVCTLSGLEFIDRAPPILWKVLLDTRKITSFFLYVSVFPSLFPSDPVYSSVPCSPGFSLGTLALFPALCPNPSGTK